MSEGVDEEGIRVITHRPEIDITKGKGDLGKVGGSTADIERRVLGKIPIEKSVGLKLESQPLVGLVSVKNQKSTQNSST
jgi:hypothetical protein